MEDLVTLFIEQRILDKSDDEKRDFYDKVVIIEHDRLKEVVDRFWHAFLYGKKKLIIIVGPTGVGKSTFIEGIEKRIKEKYGFLKEADKNRLLSATMTMPATLVYGRFDWADFYIRLLRVLLDPPELSSIRDGQKPANLRRAAENAIDNRKLLLIFFDDSQHLAEAASGGAEKMNMNAVKFITTESETPIVLLGTYGLNTIINPDGQLKRRTLVIPFNRYYAEDPTKPEDLEAFTSAIITFISTLPVDGIELPLPGWRYFYERTFGCIGLLKQWLYEALTIVLSSEDRILTKEILDNTGLYDKDDRQAMLKEILEGEIAFKNISLNFTTKLQIAEETVQKAKSTKRSKKIEAKPRRNRVGKSTPNQEKLFP